LTGLGSAHDLATEAASPGIPNASASRGITERRAALAAARVETLAEHLTPVTLATVVAASLLVWATRGRVEPAMGLVWWAVVLALTATRLALFRWYWAPHSSLPSRWLWRFGVGVGVSGVLWGASAWVFFVPDSEVHQLLLAFLLGGLSSGAAASLGCSLWIYVSWVAPAALPLTIRLAALGDPIHLTMAGTLALFIVAMGLVARGTERAFRYNLALRFDKQELIDTLLAARVELRRANAELDTRVRARTRELARAERAQRDAEGARHHGQKLEAMGRLTGGVAHDFNNLLAVVLNALPQIGALSRENPEAAALIRDAERAARRGARLTESLLAFSRTQRLKPVSVDLAAALADMQDGLLRPAAGTRVQLAVDIAEDVWPILADVDQLCAALLNLVANARDAMPSGGTLTVSAANRRLTEHPVVPAGDYVEMLIADDGVGMRAEVLERAFEPFYTTKAVGEGSGLGLSMVYGFARQSQGDVQLESRPGAGTRVRMLLPRARERGMGVASTEPPGPAPQGHGEHILLVEDEPELRRVVGRLLTRLRYQVHHAADADRALALLADENQPIDLVVSDVMMPGRLDGFGLVREARELRPGVPILLVSGYPDAPHDSAWQALPKERLAFVKKPFEATRLAQLLRQLLTSAPDA